MKKLDIDKVTVWISDYLTEFLDLPPGSFDPEVDFAALGLDSADSVIICGAFEESFDCEMDATLFLRNPNLSSLVEDLRQSGLAE